jgi:hypothetical protein
MHEVEESIVVLHHLHQWVVASHKSSKKLVVVDLCCGKGIFSTLLSYLIGSTWRNECEAVSEIVLVDKATSIDWDYLDVANEAAISEHRPYLTLWKGTNLHQTDEIMDRLLNLKATLALVGIHLCKFLSPAALSLAHSLGRDVCPFLCLAPCCLPRVVTNRHLPDEKRILEIRQYESPPQRMQRYKAIHQRDRALGRDRRGRCYICQSIHHRVHDCPSLLGEDMTDEDRGAILREATRRIPCWKCGQVGHFKADCIAASALEHVDAPSLEVSVASVLESEQPFSHYCQILAGSVEPTDHGRVRIFDTGLTNRAHEDETPADQVGNWNYGRKSIYIVAER